MPRRKAPSTKSKAVPRKPRAKRAEYNVEDYRHEGAKRVNNPPAALASYEKKSREKPKQSYAYDPHLSPQLVWAGKAGLQKIEVEEAAYCQVDTVPLYIHERVSTQAILRAVTRPEAKQLSLFADREMPLHEAVEFYQHEMDWANRLILGDSLLVMNSLMQRERMAGKVQMIYMDPPYGVKFSSNFQPRIDRRDVKDDDESLTREPEQIQAYRDTWTLGVHSYLTYLRDRLLLSRDLLTETGSIFLQISDENVHRVRLLMDVIFGAENFVSQVQFVKTTAKGSKYLDSISDSILWYGRNVDQLKYRQIYIEKEIGGERMNSYIWVESTADGTRRKLSSDELRERRIPEGWKLFSLQNMTSQSGGEGSRFPFLFEGNSFQPKKNFWKTNERGMENLARANRLMISGNNLNYVRYQEDFPLLPLTNLWVDTAIAGFAEEKTYVVQTAFKVIQRCMLMTTDTGDLVFDPTCGSGTTAFVAEQWGRRWITCDTSRVALSLARQRLLTASFPYFKIDDETRGITSGFVYKTVPHIKLENIARNEPSETETLYDQPEVDKKKARVAGPFSVEAIAPTADIAPEASQVDREDGQPNTADEHITTLIELLRKDGVTFPNNKKMTITALSPLSGGILHAEGESQNGRSQRVAVSFGPQHGPITSRQVEDGLSEAHRGGFDSVIFCGFSFDGTAQTTIQHDPHPRVRAFMAHIRPDLLMSDLLKTTATKVDPFVKTQFGSELR